MSTDRHWPKISIVTPSYNQGQFIEETIRSVLRQNYPNLEYIIMDGGSTDESIEIIKKYANHLAYWVSEPDHGQVDAINRGFELSNGEILAWLNSDDTYEPGTIQAIADAFIQNPGSRLVYGEGWHIDGSGTRIRPCSFVRASFKDVYIANKDPILQQAAFWKRDLWKEVGPLDTALNWVFDWDWFARAYRTTDFHYIPEFLANYRVHPEAKTRNPNIHRHTELAEITRRYGRRWHPNYIVQSSHIFAYRTEELTRRLPRFLARPANAVARLPSRALGRLLYGMYSY